MIVSDVRDIQDGCCWRTTGPGLGTTVLKLVLNFNLCIEDFLGVPSYI